LRSRAYNPPNGGQTAYIWFFSNNQRVSKNRDVLSNGARTKVSTLRSCRPVCLNGSLMRAIQFDSKEYNAVSTRRLDCADRSWVDTIKKKTTTYREVPIHRWQWTMKCPRRRRFRADRFPTSRTSMNRTSSGTAGRRTETTWCRSCTWTWTARVAPRDSCRPTIRRRWSETYCRCPRRHCKDIRWRKTWLITWPVCYMCPTPASASVIHKLMMMKVLKYVGTIEPLHLNGPAVNLLSRRVFSFRPSRNVLLYPITPYDFFITVTLYIYILSAFRVTS